jgi:hypothetical protein
LRPDAGMKVGVFFRGARLASPPREEVLLVPTVTFLASATGVLSARVNPKSDVAGREFVAAPTVRWSLSSSASPIVCRVGGLVAYVEVVGVETVLVVAVVTREPFEIEYVRRIMKRYAGDAADAYILPINLEYRPVPVPPAHPKPAPRVRFWNNLRKDVALPQMRGGSQYSHESPENRPFVWKEAHSGAGEVACAGACRVLATLNRKARLAGMLAPVSTARMRVIVG